MTFTDGLLLGIIGLLVTVTLAMIALILGSNHIKSIETEKKEEIRKKNLPYDFKK
jgi:ABC-type lipoprotein release transport system permease subunit